MVSLTSFVKRNAFYESGKYYHHSFWRRERCDIGRGKQLIEPRKNFTIRLSEEEREQAECDAAANGMKLSDYVRYLIVHGGTVDSTRARDRQNLIRQISGLCNNYNQMTKVANGCGYVFNSTLKESNQLMEQIRELVREVIIKWQ